MEHSDLVGGSSAERVMKCSGSVEANAAIPDVETEYAGEGKLLHEVMRLCLVNDKRPEDYIGFAMATSKGTFELTEELCATHCRPALDLFDELYETLGGEVEFIEEARLDMSALIPKAFGTVDVLIVGMRNGKKILVVLDWKFGSGVVVDARGNYQLAFYALAALYDPKFAGMVDGVEEFLFAIIQPTREPHIDTWVASLDWMRMFEATLVIAIEKAKKPNAPRHAGSWCQFCKAKLECDSFKGVVIEALQKEPTMMTSIELAWWLDRLDILNQFKNALLEHAKATLDGGGNVPGWKVIEKRANRKWRDEKQVEKLFSKLFDGAFASEVRLPGKLRSPAQMETLLKLHKQRGTIGQAQRKALEQKTIAKLTIKESSGTSLARDSEKGEPQVGVGPMLENALQRLKEE